MLGEWDWALSGDRPRSASTTSSPAIGRRSCEPARRSWPRAESPSTTSSAEHERLIGDQSDTQQQSNLLAGRAGDGASPPGAIARRPTGGAARPTLNLTNTRQRPSAGGAGAAVGGRYRRRPVRAGDVRGRRASTAGSSTSSRRTIRAALTALEGDRDAAAREYAAILPELAEMGLVYRAGAGRPRHGARAGSRRARRPGLRRRGARDPRAPRGAAFSATLEELMGERSDSGSAGSRAYEPEIEAARSGGLP